MPLVVRALRVSEGPLNRRLAVRFLLLVQEMNERSLGVDRLRLFDEIGL